jgi:hypothetical protein
VHDLIQATSIPEFGQAHYDIVLRSGRYGILDIVVDRRLYNTQPSRAHIYTDSAERKSCCEFLSICETT